MVMRVKPTTVKCRWCEKGFKTGGRGRPKVTSLFCSKRCASFARVRTAHTRTMSPTEAAYLAGLIDGEGSIVAAKKNEGRTTWRLTVCSTTPCITNWCLKATGVGAIVKTRRRQKHHAPALYWQCYSWNARDILRQIAPFMVLKKKKAERVIREMAALEAAMPNNTLTLSAGG